MRSNKVLTIVTCAVIASSVTAWHGRAQEQEQTKPDVFRAWRYPGNIQAQAGINNGSELQAESYTTSDPIAKVWAFYTKQSAPPDDDADERRWDKTHDIIKLVNQVPHCAGSASYMQLERDLAHNSVFVIHQEHQTVTVQLPQDADDKQQTHILVVIDAH